MKREYKLRESKPYHQIQNGVPDKKKKSKWSENKMKSEA